MVSGVKQHPAPTGEIWSQAPPVAVLAVALKRSDVAPVLATVRSCGSGLAPPNAFVKLIGFNCSKTLSPTTTLTGMVTLLPEAWKITCPTKVPAIAPPPGNEAVATLTVTSAGALPVAADRLSQLPPSAVLAEPAHVKVPVPPFTIWTDCAAGLVVRPVWSEYLSCPGRLPKNGVPAAPTVRVTGTVMAMSLFENSV